MATSELSGFYGAVFKRSTAACALIRNRDGGILMLRSGAGSWELPGGVAKGGEDPRSAARRIARAALGMELDVGRLLALDYVQSGGQSAVQTDSIAFVFDGGTLATAVTDFTGAGGQRQARFFTARECAEAMGDMPACRVAAALNALELGTVTELVDGKPSRGESVQLPPSRRMMPPVDGFAGILGR